MSLFPEAEPYRVLARKYRPGGFDSLIGQEAMVQTLANAIASNRLAQAWLLTGVRGVGKTSTARIIARCLNCTGPDGTGGPTVTPCGQCEACVQIAAGQHIDVIEIDAASNTGVDNIRELIEAVRYASASARYKVYIIDEVHMLSKGAFNALLKTLEEPPPHVKFVLATTEVEKVPATILSRCQRFDLKRVPQALLVAHFARVAEAEGVAAEPEALALIARVAEGSVRDGLSILDQAIAMGAGSVGAAQVRDMLGLAERGRTLRLFQAIVAGATGEALAELAAAWESGVEPAALFRDLLDVTHLLTRLRAGAAMDPAVPEGERAALEAAAAGLSFGALHRLWQLLLAGHDEIGRAPQPLDAAEMALLRIIHSAGLPAPEDLLALLERGGTEGAGTPAAPAVPAPAGPAPADPPALAQPAAPADFAGLVALFEGRDPLLAHQLHDQVRLVRYAPPRLQLSPGAGLPRDFAATLRRRLREVAGLDLEVEMVAEGGTSLHEERTQRAAEARAAARADPLVGALLAAFPEGELVDVGDAMGDAA